jgi:hypothetical protein
MSAQPSAANEPPKKKRSGCLTFLALVGAGALLVGSVVMFVAWRHGWLEKVWHGGKIAYEGMNAPGTKELHALGCNQSMVVNADDVGRLIGKDGPHDVAIVVVCMVSGETAPSCNDVAEAYVQALDGGAGSPFAVTVRNNGTGKHCTERYAADGTHQWD